MSYKGLKTLRDVALWVMGISMFLAVVMAEISSNPFKDVISVYGKNSDMIHQFECGGRYIQEPINLIITEHEVIFLDDTLFIKEAKLIHEGAVNIAVESRLGTTIVLGRQCFTKRSFEDWNRK